MKNFTLLSLVVLLCACNNGSNTGVDESLSNDLVPSDTLVDQQDSSLHLLSGLVLKLLGEWNDIQDDGTTVFHEQWQRTDDALFTGLGFVMSGADTVFIENLSISWDTAGAKYSARIPTQNGGDYVDFKLTAVSIDSMVFEAPEHDFPQRIAYVIQGDSVWNVVVSGTEKGIARSERFHFTRR
ncbi:MAG: hypothetical protein KA408_08700 [Flavobacteriales bacterium]|nr:hypothetical protein [Flavobacteriales bacterium]